MKWNIIFIFTSGVTKWTRCYGSLWFGIQEQEPWNKTRGEAVISRCKHRLHSGSVICAFIDGILSRVLVDSERSSAAFITELSSILGVIHAAVKGWPSASHLNSLHLWASLLSTKLLSDCLFFFSGCSVPGMAGQSQVRPTSASGIWYIWVQQAALTQKHWWAFVSCRCQDPRTVSLCEIKRVCKSIWMTSHGKGTEVSIKGIWEMNRTCCTPLRE